jgi:DNA-binding protein HU-beta
MIQKTEDSIMKKAEFVQELAQKAGLSKKDAEVALNATLEIIESSLAKGDTVNFIGFGSFSTSKRAARKAKVPGTDKVVDVPATTAVKFKVGKKLKDAVAK